jgi:DNA-binding NtrC family response regulator
VIGGRNGAAARLGLPRTTLISKMQRLGINRGPNYLEFAAVVRSSD